MAKLKPDEIKWILSIDAKGVNKEIAVASSHINRLAQENKTLAADMKLAEKQFQQMEKEMQKLIKAGKENTEAYQEAKATRDSARHDIDDYTLRIAENNRVIEANKAEIEKLTKSMDLNEMSMKQLKQRADELKMQLDVTSAAANPAEYTQLQKELVATEKRMREVQMSGRSLMDNLSSIPGPAGGAIRSIQGFGAALKALAANPIGAIIMIIVGAFTALKAAINSSEESANRFRMIMAPLKAALDRVMNVIQVLANGFMDFILKMNEGFNDLVKRFPFLEKIFGKQIELAEEAMELEQQRADLRKREDAATFENAKKKREIEELRFKAKQRDIYTNDQIIGFLDQAIALEGEIAQEKIEQAKIALHILETEAARSQNTEEINRKIAEQKALIEDLAAAENRRTREVESERQRTIRRLASEDAAAAKEALDKKISNIELTLKEETRLLTQQLADGLLTREQYDQAIENATMASLQRKLQIVGLERDQRLAIEQQILDTKVSALEQEEELYKERQALAKSVRTSFMDQDNQEIAAIKEAYNTRLEELKTALEKEAITELEYNEYKAILKEEQEIELAEKAKIQREARGAAELAEQDEQFEIEKMKLMEKYANRLMNEEMYQEALLALQVEYAQRALDVSELSDQQRKEAREKLLNFMIQRNQEETKLQEAEQKKRVELYSGFSQEIGTVLTGVLSGNEDIVKSSLKAILNMALDALEAQITMAIASATAQSFAQADSVATFGASGAVRAAILTGLIKGAFAGVKAIVNNSLSGTSSTSKNTTDRTAPGTGQYIVTGREDGGFIDVSRAHDNKRFIAKFNPAKRGFVNRPTVIVGDGPSGRSTEWVASNDALKNPTIAPFIQLLDESQKAGTIRTIDLNHLMRARMAGFESGGYIDRSVQSSPTPSPAPGQSVPSGMRNEEFQLMREVRDLLSFLKNNGVKAPIVISEFDRKRELLESSRNIGRK